MTPGPLTNVVTNTNNAGPNSLRQAIIDANANVGVTDTIKFNIGGGGVQSITLGFGLPNITEPVIIDGTSQPGFTASPLIEINGNGGPGLTINGGGTTIRGLVINRTAGSAIAINGGAGPVFIGGNVIEGNFFGVDPTGTLLRAQQRAISINNSPNNRIGGPTPAARNVISGSTLIGVVIQNAGSIGNVIEGNYIGLNAAGTAAIANNQAIQIQNGASASVIGGTSADRKRHLWQYERHLHFGRQREPDQGQPDWHQSGRSDGHSQHEHCDRDRQCRRRQHHRRHDSRRAKHHFR